MQFSLLWCYINNWGPWIIISTEMRYDISRQIKYLYKLNTDRRCYIMWTMLSMSHICFQSMCIYFVFLSCALSQIYQAASIWRRTRKRYRWIEAERQPFCYNHFTEFHDDYKNSKAETDKAGTLTYIVVSNGNNGFNIYICGIRKKTKL